MNDLPSGLAKAKITNDQSDFLTECLDYARRSYEDEDKRGSTVEGKALSLLSSLGITTAFMIGAGSLLFTNASKIPGIVLLSLVVLYLIVIALFIGSVWNALSVVRIDSHSYPDLTEILELQENTTNELMRVRIADLLVSWQSNIKTNNRKVRILATAQKLFSIAIIVLLSLAFVMGIYILFI